MTDALKIAVGSGIPPWGCVLPSACRCMGESVCRWKMPDLPEGAHPHFYYNPRIAAAATTQLDPMARGFTADQMWRYARQAVGEALSQIQAAQAPDIHSCSYFCQRPECIKAQRDELREKLTDNQPQRPVEMEPVAVCEGSINRNWWRIIRQARDFKIGTKIYSAAELAQSKAEALSQLALATQEILRLKQQAVADAKELLDETLKSEAAERRLAEARREAIEELRKLKGMLHESDEWEDATNSDSLIDLDDAFTEAIRALLPKTGG